MTARRTPQELLETARHVAERAYAPYSKFHVGAVAVGDDGTEYQGANVENAVYGATMCAEATAIAAAVSAGARKLETVAVATVEGTEHYPCGNCRQLMQEFDVDQVVVPGREGRAKIHALADLLPHVFSAADLVEHLEGP